MKARLILAAVSASLSLSVPCSLSAQWLDPAVLPGMETDESGGRRRPEIDAMLDAAEKELRGRPFIALRARQLTILFDNVRLCLHKDHEFAYWTREKDILGGRFWKRYRDFNSAAPGRRHGWDDSNGAYFAWVDRFHTCPDWESILALGPKGIADRARKRLETAETPEQKLFLGCVAEVYDAFSRLLARWSRFAKKKGMDDVAGSLASLSKNPPRTLRDALQLAIIYDHCQEMENESVRSQGLFDRLFIDFYRRDIAEGRETRESAKALVRDWYLRLYSLNSGNPGKNISFGGYDEHGSPVWNELTQLGFDLHYELANPSPKLSYRFGWKTPRSHLEKVTKCIADGRTGVVFANEECLAEMFRRRGKEEADVSSAVLIGCYEPGIMGREIIASMACDINLVKPLEAVFNNGCDFKGHRTGPECPLPANADEFEKEYLRQVSALVKRALDATRFFEENWYDLNPSPFLSGAYRDCIMKATDISRGGAKYNQSGCVCMGLPTVADSVAAVRYLVDEKKLVTMKELAQILKSNWKGREDLRLKASRSAPKWGNNDDAADRFAARLQKALARQINSTPNGHGGTYQAGFWSIDFNMWLGKYVAATPDGRHAKDPITRNSSASPGCGREGPTALMLSNAKFDLAEAADGHILDVVIPLSLAKRDDSASVIASMLESYFNLGGQSIHVNCFDSKLLKDAMDNPEKHQDLQVRVCGWNVRWNSLSRKEQLDFLKTVTAQEER